jgi:hypothetical protein
MRPALFALAFLASPLSAQTINGYVGDTLKPRGRVVPSLGPGCYRDVLLTPKGAYIIRDTLCWAIRPVVPPPPPPPTPVNQPPPPPRIEGWPVVAVNDGSRGDWLEAWNAGGLTFTDGVLRFVYPQGMAGGTGVGALYHALPGAQQIYVSARIKVAAGWQNHEAGMTKLFYLRTPNGGSIPWVIRGGVSGPWEIQAYPQFGAGYQDGPWLGSNRSTKQVSAGQDFILEAAVDSTTVRWWINGELAGEHTGLNYPASGFTEIQLNPVWGGIGDVKQHNDTLWMDDVTVRGVSAPVNPPILTDEPTDPGWRY